MALFSHQVEGGSLYIASLSLALVFLMAPEDTPYGARNATSQIAPQFQEPNRE